MDEASFARAGMKLYDLYSPLTVAALPGDSLTDVAAKMRYNDVGSAAVIGENEVLTGIITERDLVRAIADGADMEKTTVGAYMTEDPTFVDPNADVHEVARMMLEAGIRHMPIVADDRLVGLAAMRDILIDLIWSPRKF